MPIEINAFWHLSNPLLAFVVGLTIIAPVAALVCARAWSWQGRRRQQLKKRLAVIAEALVLVGVIGLLTFAARAKIENDIHAADANAQEQRRHLNAAIWDFAREHCLQQGPTPPTREAATLWKACAWWPNVFTSSDDFVDWWSAKDSFAKMAASTAARPQLAGQFAMISRQIEAVIASENQASTDRHAKALVETEVSWKFAACCAVIGMIGMALKLARAVLDMREPT